MITHVVLFRLPDPAQAEEVVARLRAMDGEVAGLASLTVGRDLNRGPRAWDVCLVSTHADAAALEAYQADPIHGAVKAFIGEVSAEAAVVDFES